MSFFTGGVAKVAESLLSKRKTLSSNSSTATPKKKFLEKWLFSNTKDKEGKTGPV
jgi:hypothetical protein